VVVASIHWGGNWGYPVPRAQRRFARALIDKAGVDVVHGHSSHHAKGIEVHAGRLVLYGAGDFITDYEGIGGHDEYRDDLVLMYLPEVDTATGRLARLRLQPFQLRRLRLQDASPQDAGWLADMLNREGQQLGTGVNFGAGNALELSW
jgi:poly-gamma-glutamate synthesis protein (capsule biosynthesis protein)